MSVCAYSNSEYYIKNKLSNLCSLTDIIKEDEVGKACCMVGEAEGKRTLGRSMHYGRIILK